MMIVIGDVVVDDVDVDVVYNIDLDDDDDNITACCSSWKSTSTDGPTYGRVPVIDTREGITVEGIITCFIIN